MVSEVRSLLIFDGDCGFCTGVACWTIARARPPAEAVPWQKLSADELEAVGLSRQAAGDAAWWIDERGRAWRGHLAIARSLAAGRGWSGVFGRLLLVPPFRWIGTAVYPLVSRWRHRLPGGTPACRA